MRLLILACSQTKKNLGKPAPAWNVYDGTAFRIIKKMQREGTAPPDVDILILSAKYGLLKPSDSIHFYNQKMDSHRAKAMQKGCICWLAGWLGNHEYQEVFLGLPQVYIQAISPFSMWLPKSCLPITIENIAGFGPRSAALKGWLWKNIKHN